MSKQIKEEAKDVWVKFYEIIPDSVMDNYTAKNVAKTNALVCVDFHIHQLKKTMEAVDCHTYNNIEYWKQVRQEIEII